MSKNKQVIVWEAFAGLIDEEGLEFGLLQEMQSRHCDFIGEIYYLSVPPRLFLHV